MTLLRFRFPVLAALFTLVILVPGSVTAAEDGEEELGWSDAAELSFVAITGNAESTTLGFDNTLRRVWAGARFKLEAGGLRAETTEIRRRAVGTPDDFRLVEEEETRLAAEKYYLRGRYDRDLSEKTFWFAGAGWERNEPSGLRNRLSVVVGAGRRWFESEQSRLFTDLGLTFTDQEDVVEAPGASTSFLGLRLSAEYRRLLTATTSYEAELIVDESLDDTADLRADSSNALAVAMNRHLSLKVSLQLLFDNQPALVAVPLESPGAAPTGQTVQAELEELDSTLKVTLVVDW